MENLTPRQIELVSGINRHMKAMGAGNVINNLITAVNEGIHLIEGTPVNAVNANETLTIADVVAHGETVTINNPNTEGVDIYEFLADADQILVNGNVAVDIEADTVKATGTLLVDVQPIAGDTMTIGVGDGEKEYTFVPVGTDNADGEISVGLNLGAAQTNIVAAINGTDEHNTAHTQVTASAFALDVSTITALIGGVVGDDIELSETFTAGSNIFNAATLSGGIDCSAADAITALLLAVDDGDTQGVTAVAGEGPLIVFTANVAGVSGNLIEVSVTLENGSFGDEELSGGVNGTVASKFDHKVNSTYLYIAVDDNTVADKNWRRISLGSAF